MEAAFPLAALEGEQHLAATVQVAEPFGIFGVAEVAPYIFVDTHEPVKAVLVARQLVALYHGDERLDVNPPELLIPFKLLQGTAEPVHEVEEERKNSKWSVEM